MADRICDIAIIGAGTAGLHAYHAAQQTGADVLVIERGDGGSTCTATGCIPSKLLIAAGRAAYDARRASTFGVETTVAIDGPAVLRRLRAMRDEANGKIVDKYREIPGAHRLKGTARFVGPTSLVVDGSRVEANAVIVATGGHPEIPPALDPVKSLVHTHETIFEIADLPKTMAVIGAGPLGLELAQAFARLGVAVTVLDKAKTVGKLADPEAETCAHAELRKEMAIQLGVDVSATMRGSRAEIAWRGDSEGSVEVELVLAATGRPPNLDALDLAAAGVPTDDKGVPCFAEETRRVGDTDIFVAGDVEAWRPVLHEAARGGRIAGHVAAGGPAFRPLVPLAVAFTEPNLVEVGTKFDALPDGAIIGTAKASDDIRSEIDGHDQGVVRLYADADGTLLGGTIVLTGGEHLGQTLALAIDRGMAARTFADQAWYHPVIEEMLQAAARDICRQVG